MLETNGGEDADEDHEVVVHIPPDPSLEKVDNARLLRWKERPLGWEFPNYRHSTPDLKRGV